MLLGIGYGIPFSFLGVALALIAFLVTSLIINAIKDILDNQDIIW